MATLLSAAVVVILSLVALVILPLVIANVVERDRAAVETHADPARVALAEINYRLSRQIALLTRAVATGERGLIGEYRKGIAPQQEAMRTLGGHAGALGPDYDRRLAELQHRIDLWHASVEQTVDSQRLAFDTNYPEVIESVHALDLAITGFEAERRRTVQRLERVEGYLTVGLGLLATVAACVVLWMTARLRALAAGLKEESEARQAALERERDLVRMRDRILGVVSHDLRSPLTTIALSTQLIPGSPQEERDEYVGTILAATRRMERLIQDLLDVTRIENARLAIRHETVHPADVARDVVSSHAPIAASKEIDFQASIEEDLPEIRGDADRLNQVLTNLLGNAFKFTPAGGQVRLAASRQEGGVRFEVEDTGPGISPDDLPHLFTAFWQANQTAHLGAGLGLKITAAIVEAHGGSIEASSLPAGGAVFRIDLPAPGGSGADEDARAEHRADRDRAG